MFSNYQRNELRLRITVARITDCGVNVSVGVVDRDDVQVIRVQHTCHGIINTVVVLKLKHYMKGLSTILTPAFCTGNKMV